MKMRTLKTMITVSTFDCIRIGASVAVGWYAGRAAFTVLCTLTESVLGWIVRHV